jgi:hypothetical protein
MQRLLFLVGLSFLPPAVSLANTQPTEMLHFRCNTRAGSGLTIEIDLGKKQAREYWSSGVLINELDSHESDLSIFKWSNHFRFKRADGRGWAVSTHLHELRRTDSGLGYTLIFRSFDNDGPGLADAQSFRLID